MYILLDELLFLLVIFFMHFVLLKGSLMQVGAKVCEYKSHHFKGLCFSSQHCNIVCQQEAFENGKCKGLVRRCTCFKSCGGPVDPPPYSNVPPPPPEESSIIKKVLIFV